MVITEIKIEIKEMAHSCARLVWVELCFCLLKILKISEALLFESL